jgi:hypothetical protein
MWAVATRFKNVGSSCSKGTRVPGVSAALPCTAIPLFDVTPWRAKVSTGQFAFTTSYIEQSHFQMLKKTTSPPSCVLAS